MENVLVNKRNKIHPHKFALWASMASITMMFGAFTSAYIVKQAAGNWLEFSMPVAFYISTLVIICSSITLQISFKGFKAGSESRYNFPDPHFSAWFTVCSTAIPGLDRIIQDRCRFEG